MSAHLTGRRPGAWHDILLVYRREVGARLSTKGYLAGMLITALAVVAIVLGLSYLGGTKTLTVTACGASQSDFGAVPDQMKVTSCTGPTQARARVDDEKADAAVVVTGGRVRVLVRGDSDARAQDAALTMGRTWSLNRAYAEQGVDRARLEDRTAALAPQIVTHGGTSRSKEIGAAISLVIVLFTQIVGQGSVIAQGVVEEKSTRIIEVLLSTLAPMRLMAGKVAGIGTAAVLQIVVLVASFVGATAAGGGNGPALPGTGAVASLLIWFLLSFALFAGLFAAAGSLVSRPEELQSVLMPVIVLALLPVGVAAAAAGDLSAPWVGVLQYVPPFSGLLVPLLAGVGGISLLQQLAAAAVMLLTTAGCLWLAARVYRNSILRIGAPVRWRQALAA